MIVPIATILFQIQNLLFTGSTLLLAGSLVGFFSKNFFLTAGSRSASIGSEERREFPAHEQRRAPRLGSECFMELRDSKGLFVPNSARVRNLSTMGAGFESPLKLKPGSLIEARLRSIQNGQMRVFARVVWRKTQNEVMTYGIEFKTIRPEPS
jgi:hypothetical protein